MPDIYALAKATEGELVEINAIGPIIAKSVAEFFQDEASLAIISKLREAGVNLKSDEVTISGPGPWVGMNFVVTGKARQLLPRPGPSPNQGTGWLRRLRCQQED